MPLKGRSPDDLPLAAYSTGVDPETEPEPVAYALAADDPSDTADPHGQGVRLGDDLPADPFGQAASPSDPTRSPAAPPAFRDVLRNPRGNAGDPRLILSGVVAVGLVLLMVSLVAGGGAGPGTALASPTAPTGPFITAAPAGDASVEITGAIKGTFALAGMTGTGRPAGSSMDSSWGDATGDALALGGPVSAGTRTTDAGFVLSWTVMVNGKAVTFTSKSGECVIGMAVKPTTVSGSFTCHRVKSADGKLVVSATGTYRT